MKGLVTLITVTAAALFGLSGTLPQTHSTTAAMADDDSTTIKKIYNEALTNSACYQWLDYLSNQIGGRLSGSPEAAAAVEYTKQMMEKEGFDRVYLQEVMVPHWVRGEPEIGRIVNSSQGTIHTNICALGNTIGTGPQGITAPVVEITDFKQLEELGEKNLKGKIVFYNRPMNPTFTTTFYAYGDAVPQRTQGASLAAPYGAVAVLVRSMSLRIDKHPHTGAQNYKEGVKQIPAVAISTQDAETLSALLKKDEEVQFYLRTTCEMLPDVKSYNVIGELKGSEHPEEIIVVGGHLDAWDNGDGAHDDGAGCVQAMEVLRIFKKLGIRPKRTLRAVMFMNEENGLRGGKEYAKQAEANNETHIAAMESDAGGFTPRGFGILTENEAALQKIMGWQPLLAPYGLHEIGPGYGGADINQLKKQNCTLIGFRPDSQRYFDYHHAPTDTFDKVNKRELEMGAASMAALTYLLDRYGL